MKHTHFYPGITKACSLFIIAHLLTFSVAFSQRSYNIIWSQNVRGGHTMFGNTSMAISSGGSIDLTKMNDFGNYGNGTTSQYGNDNSDMEFVDVDGTIVAPPATLLAMGSGTWSYFNNNQGNNAAYTAAPADNPAATNWTQSAYSSGNLWNTGQSAPLRFNIGSGGTTLGSSNAQSIRGRNTYYFRNTFTVTGDVSLYTALAINVRYDDGVVVYVNGTEVGRSDIAAGSVSYNTNAGSCNTAATYRTASYSVPVNLITAGTNTVAVEVHQGPGCTGNADMYMDLEFTGTVTSVSNTANSSAADLILPATGNTSVKFARLYWGGRINTADITAGDANLKAIKIKYGSGAYTTFTSTNTVDKIDLGNGATVYQSYYDVTGFVNTYKAGTYTVADLAATTGSVSGGGNYAGWAIVVAYENDQMNYNSTRMYDAYLQVYSGGSAITDSVTLTGFDAPGSVLSLGDAYLSTFAWEGDANLGSSAGNPAGDFLHINGNAYSDSLNPGNNMWNGTISRNGNFVTSKNPDLKNQMGLDIDEIQVGSGYGIAPNATTVGILFGTEADQYFPSVFAFSLRMKDPTLTINKTATGSIAPGEAFLAYAGETITYTIKGQNTGAGQALNTNVVDSIPFGVSYVPGSLKILVSPGGFTGSLSDIKNTDQAFYTDASAGKRGYVKFLLGNGAVGNTSDSGGTGGSLLPLDSYRVSFQVVTLISQSISNIAWVNAISETGLALQNQASKFLGSPLLVKLTRFDAEAKNGRSLLSWSSASEKNSDYYDVQYSTDGNEFTSIGKIKAAGNATMNTDYSFTHEHPQPGINFYRLRMVDIDGSAQYSDVRTVRFDNGNNGIIIMPNPVTGTTRLVLPATLDNSGQITIFNSMGSMVYKADVPGLQVVLLDLSILPSGLYQVVVTDGQGRAYHEKIIKR